MTDQKRKSEMIQSIEYLQLSTHLISALEHAQHSESIADAITALQALSEQWN